MKNLLMIFTFLGVLLGSQVAYAEVPPITFLNYTFKFEKTVILPPDKITNAYTTDNNLKNILALSYTPTGIHLRSAFDYHKKLCEKRGILGSTKKSKNKIALSILKPKNGVYNYEILRVENNDIAGSNISFLKLDIAPDKADIKALDQKYFQSFYKAKFPSVFDENGEILPPIYPLSIGEDKFVLKYSATDNQDVSNYYLPRRQNFYNYKSIVRINTRSDINSPDKIAKMIIENKKPVKGFKLIADESSGKDRILSYSNNEIQIKDMITTIIRVRKDFIKSSKIILSADNRAVVELDLNEHIPMIPKTLTFPNNIEYCIILLCEADLFNQRVNHDRHSFINIGKKAIDIIENNDFPYVSYSQLFDNLLDKLKMKFEDDIELYNNNKHNMINSIIKDNPSLHYITNNEEILSKLTDKDLSTESALRNKLNDMYRQEKTKLAR